MKDMMAAIERRMSKLHGIPDARSSQGIMARGKNVYNGGTPMAHSGPMMMKPMKPVKRKV